MDAIEYSAEYEDTEYIYRHVKLPPIKAIRCPEPLRILSETEWRALGVRQRPGWEHYAVHRPEPHILLFRRPKENSMHAKKRVKLENKEEN